MSLPDSFYVALDRGAEDDVRAIASYLSEHYSRETAREFIEGLLARIAALEHYPLRGSVPRELETLGITAYRQLLFGRHRIVYKVLDRSVTVVLVADGRRDMQTLLRARLLAPDPPA